MSTLVEELNSQNRWVADGVQTIWNFNFAGGYVSDSHVKAYYETPDGVTRTDLVINPGTDLLGPFQLQVTPAVPSGYTFVIYRDTPKDNPLVDFNDGSALTETSLDVMAKQSVFVSAEVADLLSGKARTLDVETLHDEALAYTDSKDAARKAYEDALHAAALAYTDSKDAARKSYVDAADVALGVRVDQARAYSEILVAEVTAGASFYIPTVPTPVVRTVQSKLDDIRNIRDFGAAADNVTDDTAAVLLAAQSGETVSFGDGQMCRVTANIGTWADGTKWLGSGSTSSGGIRLDTATATLDAITITSKSDFWLHGLTINAGRSGPHTAGSSIRLVGCSDSYVTDCHFVLPCSDTVLVRDACDNVKVLGNKFDVQGGGTAHIYFLTNATNCEASDNYFADSVGGCIWLSGNVLHTTIRRNRCSASEYELIGIRWDCAYGEVSGNVATGTGDNGISVTGRGFRVFGNECYGNDFAGIGVYGSDNTVTANECRDNGVAGGSQHPGILLAAQFGGLAANNVITGNEIYRRDGATTEQYYGIRLSNTSYTAWANGQVVTSGTYRTNANGLYVSTTAGTTGATPPTHTTGTASDDTVTWQYIGTFANTAARPAGNRIGPNKIRNHTGGDVIRFGTAVNHFNEESQNVVTYAAPAWATGVATEVGDVVYNVVTGVERRYRSHTSATTGATAPTHTSGTASDGTVTWYYIGEGPLNDVLTLTEDGVMLTVPLRIQCFDSTSGTLAPNIYAGTTSPEGAVTAANGSIYLRSNSTYGIAVYIKTGTTNTNTGWQPLMMRMSGSTANRPSGLTGAQTGLEYFDTTLGRPIWWKTAGWVDAAGAGV